MRSTGERTPHTRQVKESFTFERNIEGLVRYYQTMIKEIRPTAAWRVKATTNSAEATEPWEKVW